MGKKFLVYVCILVVSFFAVYPALGQDEDVNQQAVKRANEYFREIWLWDPASESWFLAYELDGNTVYVQAKRLHYHSEPREIGPLDRENGLLWLGVIFFRAEQVRKYNPEKRTWEPWNYDQKAIDIYAFEDRYGIWKLLYNQIPMAIENSRPRRPFLSEIPVSW